MSTATNTNVSVAHRGTLTLAGWRPWALLIAMVFVALAELTARVSIKTGVGEGLYGSASFHAKVVEIDALQRAEAVDVLFVGTSLAESAVNAPLIDSLCREQGVEIVSYNLGVSGASLKGSIPLLQRFILPKVRPSIVFIALSPNALNAGRAAWVERHNERFRSAAMTSPLTEQVEDLLSSFFLFRYRRELSSLLQTFDTAILQASEQLGRSGYGPLEGVQSNAVYGERLKSFSPDLHDLAALDSLCDWCRSVGAAYVIVNLPISEANHAVLTEEQWALYEDVLEAASREGIPVVTFERGMFTAQDFYDGIHLNTQGAEKIAPHFAEQIVRHFTQLRAASAPVPGNGP